jgi:hypothetical protein
MGSDLNSHPMCGVRILSSNKLSELQVKELIKERIVTNDTLGMMSVKEYVHAESDKLEDFKNNSKNPLKNRFDDKKSGT